MRIDRHNTSGKGCGVQWVKPFVKGPPILNINVYERAPDFLYPIQPYPWKNFGFPSRPFSRFVAFYHQSHVILHDRSRNIYPTGGSAVVCRLDGCRSESFLVGTPTIPRKPGYLTYGGDYFVAFFWFGIGFCLFPLPPSEIVDSDIPLEEIFPEKAQRLISRMTAADTFCQRVDAFEGFLSEIVMGSRQIPKRHHTLIRKTYGAATTRFDFESNNGVDNDFSDRHVRRLIIKYTGISPKLFMRIIRYQKTLHSISTSPNQSMALLSAEQGYSDQPHFIKEFKRFQGLTPNKFVRRFISKRDAPAGHKGRSHFQTSEGVSCAPDGAGAGCDHAAYCGSSVPS